MNQRVQEIIKQVDATGCLGKTPRQVNLLEYLLTENFEGRLRQISQYSIASDVLGRDDSFDPTNDSIVRSEMYRLRNNLQLFNSQSPDIQLKIPRASFKIIITKKTSPKNNIALAPFLKPSLLATAAIVVAGFGVIRGQDEPPFQQQSLDCSTTIPNIEVVQSGKENNLQLYTDRVIRATLAQYTRLKLVDDIGACSNSGTPSFTLDYMVYEQQGNYRIALTVYNDQKSNIVGFKTVDGVIRDPKDRDDLFFALVSNLGEFAKPYGTIPRYAITKKWGNVKTRENYQCLIRMYDYYDDDTKKEYARNLQCLGNAAKLEVASFDNLGGLAQTYLEQVQGYRTTTVPEPIKEVKNILDRVGDDWIKSTETTIAKIVYEVEREDYNAGRLKGILNTAENRYDANPQVLLTAAVYYGYKLGDWPHAKLLSDRVKRIHSDRLNSIFVIDAANALLNNDPRSSITSCKRVYAANSLVANIIVRACAAQSNDAFWLAKTQNNLDRLGFGSKAKQIAFIKSKQLEPKFSARIIRALEKNPI